jgi:hypothetical protein
LSNVRVKWIDQGWAALKARLMSKSSVNVGVLGTAAEEQHGDSDATVGEIALIQEFGNDHIPARPFVREAVVWGDHAGLKRIMAKVAKDVLRGTPQHVALAEAGRWAVRKIRATISSRVFVPNAPSTVLRKGNDYTLRDSYQMRNAVSFEIVRGLFSGFGAFSNTSDTEEG